MICDCERVAPWGIPLSGLTSVNGAPGFSLSSSWGEGGPLPQGRGGGKQKWTCSIQLYIMYRVYTGIFYDFFKTEFCFYRTCHRKRGSRTVWEDWRPSKTSYGASWCLYCYFMPLWNLEWWWWVTGPTFSKYANGDWRMLRWREEWPSGMLNLKQQTSSSPSPTQSQTLFSIMYLLYVICENPQ